MYFVCLNDLLTTVEPLLQNASGLGVLDSTPAGTTVYGIIDVNLRHSASNKNIYLETYDHIAAAKIDKQLALSQYTKLLTSREIVSTMEATKITGQIRTIDGEKTGSTSPKTGIVRALIHSSGNYEPVVGVVMYKNIICLVTNPRI